MKFISLKKLTYKQLFIFGFALFLVEIFFGESIFMDYLIIWVVLQTSWIVCLIWGGIGWGREALKNKTMNEKSKEFLKQTANFFKKSYPKPIIIIILAVFFVSIILVGRTTANIKADIKQKITEREKEITKKYNAEVAISERWKREYEEYKESEEYKKSEEKRGYKPISQLELMAQISPTPLEKMLSYDYEIKEMKRIKNASFNYLWLENFITHPIFILVILTIILLPIIRALVLLGLYTKKQFQEIRKMTTFQKYLIGLVFGVLIALILILLM